LLLLSTFGLATGTALLWREQAQTKEAFESAQANLDLALQALDQIYVDEAGGLPKIREGLTPDLLQKGLGFYEAFIKANARNKGLVFLMGRAHQRAGLIFRELGEEERAVESLEGAISAYDRAIEIDARDTLAHINRGNALLELGNFEAALAAFDRAIEIDPRNSWAHSRRGAVLCDHLDRPGEALAEFDRAIELDPQSGDHTNRGRALRGLKRFEDALAACDRAIEIDPWSADAHNSRGYTLYHHLGRLEDALAAFDRALEIDPRSAEAHTNRGDALGELGRPEDAIAAYDQAIGIDPRNSGAHTNRGNALGRLRRFEDSLAAYDRALEIDPRSAVTHINRGKTLHNLGRFEDALAACDRALKIDPLDAWAHNSRGMVLEAKGEVEAAIGAYGEAIRLDQDYAEAHCNLGRALMRRGRFQEAVLCFRRGHALGSRRAGEWIEDAERKAELEGRVDQVLSGKARPRDAVERIEFASVLYDRARHAESARMYAEAFADDAALAEDLAEGHRYNAACSAALAAAPGGADAAEWGDQALEWLRADLAARGRAPSDLVATLEHWKRDPDFASVRDRLGDLPEPEREAWRGLWAAVDLALAAARPASK
jgi:tetratricopeptide (TPR) repeat protein